MSRGARRVPLSLSLSLGEARLSAPDDALAVLVAERPREGGGPLNGLVGTRAHDPHSRHGPGWQP
eukprot:7377187-Prymnesium_polylepis.2